MIKKEKKQNAGDLLYGINPIVELLRAKKRSIFAIYTTVQKPKNWEKIAHLLPKQGKITINHVGREVLVRMTGCTEHQGVVALVQPFRWFSGKLTPATHPLVVMLDGIQDPRNVGAIIRTASCVGVTAVILIAKNGVALTPVVHKAAAGYAEQMTLVMSPSVSAALNDLQKAGYGIYTTMSNGAIIDEYDFQEAGVCIVIGSEGEGASSLSKIQGRGLAIPQVRSDMSYNASVAAGIVLFAVARKKRLL